MSRVTLWPIWPPPSSFEYELVGGVSEFRAQGGGALAQQRVDLGTQRWRLTLRYEGLRREHRAALKAAAFAGKKGTVFYVANTEPNRGSWATTYAPEIWPEWKLEGEGAHSAATGLLVDPSRSGFRDRNRLRLDNRSNQTTTAGYAYTSATATPAATHGQSYALRTVVESLRASQFVGFGVLGTTPGTQNVSAGPQVIIPYPYLMTHAYDHRTGNTTLSPMFVEVNVVGAGVYTEGVRTVESNFFGNPSFQRVMRLDARPNLLQESQGITTSGWTGSRVVTPFAGVSAFGPDSLNQLQVIQEDTTSGEHVVSQGVTLADIDGGWLTFTCYAAPGSRSFILLSIIFGAGAATAYFDLATGAVGNLGQSGGITDVAGRIQTVDAVSGLRRCQVSAYFPSGVATAVTCAAYIAQSNGVANYLGTSSTVLMGCFQLTRSAHASAYRATLIGAPQPNPVVTAAETIYVMGMEPSVGSQLLAGDALDINGEYKEVVDSVSADALGLATVRISPAVRGSYTHGTPIWTNRPMGRFVLAEEPKILTRPPGYYSDVEVVFEEAF